MEALTPCGVKNTTNDHATRDMTINVSIISANETPESGFRFAYIELQDEDTALTLQAIKGCFYYRDLEYKGSFECSDERLNRIWQTAAYTVHLCMQQYLWDGIKRDRLVWIGDMHTEVQTILSVFGNVDIIAKSLDLGATTFFEDFNLDWVENSAPIDEIVPEGKRDIHGDFGAYCYKLFRHSLCHGWSSGPCPYMTHYVLGIRAKDKDTYIVAPELADLEWAKGSYPTDKGLITVSARKTQRGTEVEISAPEGITVVRA